VVAIGTIDRAENWVLALGELKPPLNIAGRNGHAVTGLMARAARAAVNPQALKKGSRQIDPFAGCAVRLRRATWIREMRSARDDRDLLCLYRGNDHQRREKLQTQR